jgi:hypothetical protein
MVRPSPIPPLLIFLEFAICPKNENSLLLSSSFMPIPVSLISVTNLLFSKITFI